MRTCAALPITSLLFLLGAWMLFFSATLHCANYRQCPVFPCRLVEDTAWHPVQKEVMDNWSPVERFVYKTFLGSPLKLWASIGHWWIWHFDLSK